MDSFFLSLWGYCLKPQSGTVLNGLGIFKEILKNVSSLYPGLYILKKTTAEIWILDLLS